MSKYNNKYLDVFYKDKNLKLYNELTNIDLDVLYSETQIKLIELIKNYNFKIFYFNCKPATKNKLIINNKIIDLESKDVNKIKINQAKDFYYIYKNKICEVFYSFLKLDKENNYYFDFMLVVDNNFKLNDVYNYKFKSIEIESVKEIFINDLTFELIEDIFEERIITFNNCSLSHDKESYDLNKINFDFDKFIEKFKKNSLDFNYVEYLNFNSFYFYKRFNQEKYVRSCFKLLCSQIWAIDRIFFKEENKYGFRIDYTEEYDLNSVFLVNFAELMNYVPIDSNNEKKQDKKEYHTHLCLKDIYTSQGILQIGLYRELINNKKLDFDNLTIVAKNK